jgi:uncharacterized damage-inducible protein DinB
MGEDDAMTNRSTLIETICALPDRLEAKVKGLSAEQLTTHHIDDEWSVAQVVHHMADSHMNSFVRFKLVLTEDNPTLRGFDEKSWANTVDANNPDIAHSLAILRGVHARWCALLDSIADDQWPRLGTHASGHTETLDTLINTYANHSENHLRQIQTVLDAMNG